MIYSVRFGTFVELTLSEFRKCDSISSFKDEHYQFYQSISPYFLSGEKGLCIITNVISSSQVILLIIYAVPRGAKKYISPVR